MLKRELNPAGTFDFNLERMETGIIVCGQGPSPFGPCQIAGSEKGICGLGFAESWEKFQKRLLKIAGRATIIRDEKTVAGWLEKAFLLQNNLPLDLKGTPFQTSVWKVLRSIPAGETCSYAEVASLSGRPRAVRAVANAVAANPVAWLVPCHRVIHRDGSLGGYHWGTARKRAMLEYESRHRTAVF